MPEKGPLYAHLRKDEQWAAAAALGRERKFVGRHAKDRSAPIGDIQAGPGRA
jgi:hypothetical protein